MKNWRIWAGLGAAILVAAAGIYAAYVWWLADPASVGRDSTSAAVQRGRIVATVKGIGSVSVPNRSTLTFSSAGRIKELPVVEGSVVKAGDVLARLDTADLEAQVARAEAALALSKAQLAKTQAGPTEADVKAAAEAVAAAEAKMERVKAGPLASEIASAEAALSSAEANYQELVRGPSADQRTVLQANVEKAKVAVEQAQAAYDRIAWQGGAAGSPQAAALQRATIEYQQTLASYNLAAAAPASDLTQRAQAQIASARAQLDRLRTTGTNDELKSASALAARARADLDKLKNSPTPQELTIAQATAQQAEVLLKQAKRQLDEATLIAPYAGTVAAVGANVGQWVAAATPVVVLADLTRLQAQVNVHESYVGRIQKGQAAQLVLEALPDTPLQATVGEISPLPTAGSGIVSYQVTLNLASTPLAIRPGMVGQAEIIVAAKDGVLLAPRGALRLRAGHWFARVLRNGRPAEVEVTLGERQGREIEILNGLAEGDQVLLYMVASAEEGR